MNIGESFRCPSLTLEKIRDILAKEMPEYETEIRGRTLCVKKTFLKGVRIFILGDKIHVNRKPPTLLGVVVDDLLFQFVSSFKNTVLAQRIITLLKKECL